MALYGGFYYIFNFKIHRCAHVNAASNTGSVCMMSFRITNQLLHADADVGHVATHLERCSMYSSQNITRILSRTMKWARHVVRIGVKGIFLRYVHGRCGRAESYKRVRGGGGGGEF